MTNEWGLGSILGSDILSVISWIENKRQRLAESLIYKGVASLCFLFSDQLFLVAFSKKSHEMGFCGIMN